VSNVIEPLFGILGDVRSRRALILGGGLLFTAELIITAISGSFPVLLAAFVLLAPASGAFVGLSQAALIDAAPERCEQNMARWTLAGSVGNAAGTLLLAGAAASGLGWRALFVGMAGLSLLLVANAWRFSFPTPSRDAERPERATLRDGARDALRALKRREVLRWLVLLEFADLTWDVLRGFLALYFVDVVQVSGSEAALAVLVWTCVGLPGDVLLIPMLERVSGVRYLRWSVRAVLLLFPAFLLAPGFGLKLVVLGLLGFANAGWYSILKARLYSAMPGQSGAVLALSNVFGIASGLVPLALGAFAGRYGLGPTMWLLLAGPLALLIGLAGAGRK
ncbi:MAG: MFS transporter, partial [Pyrinomonadaceae bacterium]